MKLTVVIPAYNEEEAIGSTVQRCLEARTHITQNSPVHEVEIIVVSDGSTDRTVEIARGFSDVQLIVFEHNRGYGAAIKRGFEVGTGDVVGFLDADGTCDPRFFADLCSALQDEQAEVALGGRLGPTSRMPNIRRLGNRIYALILSALSNKVVTDTASGMRVIRRDALDRLYPLPDGLHFTPAMSARVLMDEQLRIVEVPMHYEERVGESKLHVLRDGIRFFQTIFEMTLMWRPTRIFVLAAAMCFAFMFLLGMHPIESWLSQGSIAESTIYRLLFCSLLGTMGTVFISTAVLGDLLHRLVDEHVPARSFVGSVLDRAFTFRGFAFASIPAVPLMLALVGAGFWSRLTTGEVSTHWSRAVLAGLVFFGWGQMLTTVLLANILRFHTMRRDQRLTSASQSSSTRSSGGQPGQQSAPNTKQPVFDAPIPPPQDEPIHTVVAESAMSTRP
jgi:glycosyltransferase involved in cell wall biosynthesis